MPDILRHNVVGLVVKIRYFRSAWRHITSSPLNCNNTFMRKLSMYWNRAVLHAISYLLYTSTSHARITTKPLYHAKAQHDTSRSGTLLTTCTSHPLFFIIGMLKTSWL